MLRTTLDAIRTGRAHLRTMDSTMYHGCHGRSVPELSPLLVREFGISYPSLRQMDCVETFKRHLKTKFFMDAYCISG